MAPKPLILSTKKAVDAITAFFTPRMAADAKVDGLDKLLLALDESEEDDDKKERAEDENDLPEPGGEKGKGPAKDKAKDMKAKDKASEEEDDKAEDEEDDEDEKKGEDEETVTKEDVKSAMDEAIAGERQRQHAIRDAERFVRPWVGDLNPTIAFDSAEDVYKTALEMRGKATKGIHPSAYRSILEMVPKPGSEHRNTNSRVAMDSATTKGFSEMYPDAMRIGINH